MFCSWPLIRTYHRNVNLGVYSAMHKTPIGYTRSSWQSESPVYGIYVIWCDPGWSRRNESHSCRMLFLLSSLSFSFFLSFFLSFWGGGCLQALDSTYTISWKYFSSVINEAENLHVSAMLLICRTSYQLQSAWNSAVTLSKIIVKKSDLAKTKSSGQ